MRCQLTLPPWLLYIPGSWGNGAWALTLCASSQSLDTGFELKQRGEGLGRENLGSLGQGEAREGRGKEGEGIGMKGKRREEEKK